MALVRKGSRLIVVDGVTYRWKVRHKASYGQALGESPLRFAVELAAVPGAVLLVSLPAAHPGNWLNLPTMGVRPAVVASGIRRGLTLGWQPARPGSPFPISIGVERPGSRPAVDR